MVCKFTPLSRCMGYVCLSIKQCQTDLGSAEEEVFISGRANIPLGMTSCSPGTHTMVHVSFRLNPVGVKLALDLDPASLHSFWGTRQQPGFFRLYFNVTFHLRILKHS